MSIKEEIHGLSDDIIKNMGRLVAIDSQLGTPGRGNAVWRRTCKGS